MTEATFEEFSIDIDESRAGRGGPPVNLFNVDMKYQSIDFTPETSSGEQDVKAVEDNSVRASTPPPPPLDIFGFDMKYTEDPLEDQNDSSGNNGSMGSVGPSLTSINFGNLSRMESTENKPSSVSSNEAKGTAQQNLEKKPEATQNAQQSVLMKNVLQKIKTSQSSSGETVKIEQQTTEVKITKTEGGQKITEKSSALTIENNSRTKSCEDSDDEFDFDVPTSKNTPQNLTAQTDIPNTKDSSLPFPALKSQTATESVSPSTNVENQPTVKVVSGTDVPIGPGGNVPGENLANQGISHVTADKQKITSQGQTVSEIGNSVLKQVCENGAISETFHVNNRAEDEWDKVQTIEAGFVDENDTRKKESVVTNAPMLSFFEMLEHFVSEDFSGVKDKIRTTVERHGFSALKYFLFGPPKLHKNLHEERDRIFCIAASVLENSNQIHIRSLQTIYRSLTGSRFDCPRFGNHWEEIGFQGRDPSTDLRGVGLLGLLHLIYLLRDAKRQVLASEIYKLSLHPTQNFPFCVMSINLSRIALQALREGCLNKECNKQKEVLPVVCDFYTGLYLQMYQVWKSQGKTISDSGFVLQHIENHAKRNPHAVMKNLEEYLAKKKSAANLDNVNLGEEQFTSVVDSETAGHY
ncbi:ELMO domain-containing protein 3-like [Saccostrea echinata]|uniref:ELMO domain-containing protein 3-like n=1 Tax=Saccostrea echinata TaxID=191078 RepID=UPI002A7F93C3|nr:ELMO domain-containing protein 3-like [Saccostrea echinata]